MHELRLFLLVQAHLKAVCDRGGPVFSLQDVMHVGLRCFSLDFLLAAGGALEVKEVEEGQIH